MIYQIFLIVQAEDTINVLTKLNNKKIGSKHIAIRYAKHVNAEDDGKTSKHLKIPALAAGNSSKASIADKKSKIQKIEEQLRNLQNSPNDFQINLNKNSSPAEPLIKKYQFNKDAQASTSKNCYRGGRGGGRHKPYERR